MPANLGMIALGKTKQLEKRIIVLEEQVKQLSEKAKAPE